ncbi:MLO-like protein 13 [Gossypium arboreum]|uniref:MLO-like protein 13 n=1 Tax=Gossypium arboreum TaxID=29729 RepID=UPI0022F14DA1|nr:MLO-like protein 13 [Gossypium arboreum]
MSAEAESNSLEFTPTWVVAAVCFIIVLISIIAERGLHRLGKYLKHKKQDALFEALQKLKEELMLLGFISLLLTVFQGLVSEICIPAYLATTLLPCERHSEEKTHEEYTSQAINNRRRLISTDNSSDHCSREGKVPLLSLEALHHLHIFIFVLAVVHVIFCVITMVLGGARIRQWKQWEESILKHRNEDTDHHHTFFARHAQGYWRRAAVVSWIVSLVVIYTILVNVNELNFAVFKMSFFKQFYDSVTKSDYLALREGFIRGVTDYLFTPQTQGHRNFDFHGYMIRTLEVDFKKIVGISWYLWLFVVVFLLLNVEGWHTYFWLSFLPVILLLLVGTKLEHIITRLAQEVDVSEATQVKPSDTHFWFEKPGIVLHLIHFILFQNAFELAFFFWILCTYGFHSCIMERMSYIIPRLIMGVMVQVLCSYSTLPLYALVTLMGSQLKEGLFKEFVRSSLDKWFTDRKGEASKHESTSTTQMDRMVKESYQSMPTGLSIAGETTLSITVQYSGPNP